MHRTAPHNKNYLYKTLAVLRLRNPHLVPWKTPPGALSAKHIVGTIRLWVAIIIPQGVYHVPHVGFKCFLRQAKGPTIEIYENNYIVLEKGDLR